MDPINEGFRILLNPAILVEMAFERPHQKREYEKAKRGVLVKRKYLDIEKRMRIINLVITFWKETEEI